MVFFHGRVGHVQPAASELVPPEAFEMRLRG